MSLFLTSIRKLLRESPEEKALEIAWTIWEELDSIAKTVIVVISRHGKFELTRDALLLLTALNGEDQEGVETNEEFL
jgi:Co/Zn/Cd efflux system component